MNRSTISCPLPYSSVPSIADSVRVISSNIPCSRINSGTTIKIQNDIECKFQMCVQSDLCVAHRVRETSDNSWRNSTSIFVRINFRAPPVLLREIFTHFRFSARTCANIYTNELGSISTCRWRFFCLFLRFVRSLPYQPYSSMKKDA